MPDERLVRERYPRAAAYNPAWVLAGVGGAANPLWLAEWLAEAMDLRPGMRVLDLGCGRALSSVFFHREFGVQVWAVDLWCSPEENFRRIQDAGVAAIWLSLHRLILVFVILTSLFVTAAITMFLRYPLGEDDHNSRIATLAARENGLAAQSPSGLG